MDFLLGDAHDCKRFVVYRRGHDDLGDHYLDCGDLSNALKCYSRARDYCTSAKHVVTMCLNVIKVSVYLQNWSHVSSYVTKAESTPIHSPEVSASKNCDWSSSKAIPFHFLT